MKKTKTGRKAAKNSNGSKALGLCEHFAFHNHFGCEPNSLLTDGKSNLYLAECIGGRIKSSSNFQFKPARLAKREDVSKVSVGDACAWYARCEPWGDGSWGDVAILCGAAAKEIDRLKKRVKALASRN